MLENILRDALILFATIDPIGSTALFAAVTASMTPERRKKTASKAMLYSFAVLLGSMVLGQLVLSTMGVQLISLQVAGGVILFLFGIQMIFGKEAGNPEEEIEQGHDPAVFPLSVPNIAGPGSIMAVIVLTDNATRSFSEQLMTAGVLMTVLLFTYGLMRAAEPILRVIGRNGAAILVRVMGMLLAALSVELVMDALGIAAWVTQKGLM